MSQTGEAAEQVVSMATNVTVKGVECVANLSGKAASSLASFLLAAIKDEKRVSGKTRMRSFKGKPTQVFVINKSELKDFAAEARKYGVLYAAVVDKRNADGLCDIVVSAEDAAKVNRIADRFALSAVDVEKIRENIIQARKLAAEHSAGEQTPPQPANAEKQQERPDPASDKPHTVTEAELHEMLGQSPAQAQPVKIENPTSARRTKAQAPSGRTSATNGSTERDTEKRPSVRREIREIKAAQEQQDRNPQERQRPQYPQQPRKNNKKKSRGR